MRETGPGALLVRRSLLERYLKDNDYSVLWVINGRKCLIGGSMSPDAFQGSLDISVVCGITDGAIESATRTKYTGPK